WLGLPLAKFLIGQGYSVKGSTTTADKLESLRAAGIDPFQIKLDPEIAGESIESFLESPVLIVNIPPQRRDDIVQYHQRQIESLIQAVKKSPVKKVVFVSATSVYPPLNRVVREEDAVNPDTNVGEALCKVEKILIDESAFETTVIRFCGLIGYDRKPGKFYAGKKNLIGGHEPVNIIHQDDCVQIIFEIISQQKWGKVYNACSDKHPLRKDFYTKAAALTGFEVPEFADDGKPVFFKVINSDKLKKELGFSFKYPDPLKALTDGDA
ncbi:MAG: SDR family NAD(P)-dependent oxidoreductase, partial [Chlorobiales bacterium]|nr:SDR family NAD(P)-dependent oxidoreductase [Chlorobiales bacterium]